jgi:hypothetical protein
MILRFSDGFTFFFSLILRSLMKICGVFLGAHSV